jgi:hypothetical protein
VQIKPLGEIAVHRFLDPSGGVILSAPPAQLLSLTRQISQELSQKFAFDTAAGIEKGDDHGH